MTLVENSSTQVVCLVDDDPSVLKSIGRLLASDGFSVRAFHTPGEFLVHAENHRVPVVVLDILMGEMNGLEVQARLRIVSPQTRVIIITGCEDSTARPKAVQLGVIGFFIKPFDSDQFLSA